MGSPRKVVVALVVGALLSLASIGVVAAQTEQAATSPPSTQNEPDAVAEPTADEDELLARLGELEAELPQQILPVSVTFTEGEAWGRIEGDAGGLRAVLDTLEPELRRLFIDADEADGPVADAVAEVARGWLDVWQGAQALARWETHDLAFPVNTFDEDGVATGADEIRGRAEIGFTLILDGRARHLDGYVALRELGAAASPVQAMLDRRAADAESFDAEIRPLVTRLLSRVGPTVVAVVERFETTAPGIEPRARSISLVCLDRDALAEATGVASPEVIPEIAAITPTRIDCPEVGED